MSARLIRNAVLAGLLLALSGCARSDFRADVTRFHQGEVAPWLGKTLTVRQADQTTDPLAFSHQALIVGEKLGALGFEAAGGAEPEIIALLDVRMTPVATAQESGASISIGGGSFGRHGGVGGGLSFPVGDKEPETGYDRQMSLALTDARTGERFWEGRAVSLGKTGDPDRILPLLADALLQDFPGESGRMVRVRIPEPQ